MARPGVSCPMEFRYCNVDGKTLVERITLRRSSGRAFLPLRSLPLGFVTFMIFSIQYEPQKSAIVYTVDVLIPVRR